MADEGNILTDLDGDRPAPNGADNQPAIGLISQYIKDLSVENPNAPKSYQWQAQPELDLQINVQANRVDAEVNEVMLKMTATAKASQGVCYIVELAYCGLIGMRNVPDDQAHAFLFAEAPRILFPFARRVIADAVRDAGYPPLLLDPVDFSGLYLQQLAQRQQEDADFAPAPPVGEG